MATEILIWLSSEMLFQPMQGPMLNQLKSLVVDQAALFFPLNQPYTEQNNRKKIMKNGKILSETSTKMAMV